MNTDRLGLRLRLSYEFQSWSESAAVDSHSPIVLGEASLDRAGCFLHLSLSLCHLCLALRRVYFLDPLPRLLFLTPVDALVLPDAFEFAPFSLLVPSFQALPVEQSLLPVVPRGAASPARCVG